MLMNYYKNRNALSFCFLVAIIGFTGAGNGTQVQWGTATMKDFQLRRWFIGEVGQICRQCRWWIVFWVD